MEKVTFDGTEESILKIMEILPVGNKAIRRRGNAITINPRCEDAEIQSC